jgi:TPR repeat protein
MKRSITETNINENDQESKKKKLDTINSPDLLIKQIVHILKEEQIEATLIQETKSFQEITYFSLIKVIFKKYGKYTRQSLKCLEYGQELGDPDCINWLGKHYMVGIVVKKDLDKALILFESARTLGCVKSYKNLGRVHHLLNNLKKALEMYHMGEKLGDPSAICYLGEMYENGEVDEEEPDFDRAKEMYEIAYNSKESKHAIYNMGRVYHHGIGVPCDYTKAKDYYEEGIKRDSKECYNNLGVLYYEGLGVKRDYQQAFTLYTLSANMEDAKAMYNLGLLYKHGRGVPKDHAKEKALYERAVERGNEMAMNNLGLIYKIGLGVEVDPFRAVYWFEMGANQKNFNAMHNLATMYEEGLGVEENVDKAISLYEECIRDGEVVASMSNLADLYYTMSEKTKKNYEKAEYYYDLAIQHKSDDPFVLGNLGLILIQGLGTNLDATRGIELILKAFENDYSDPKASYFVGCYLFERRDYDTAVVQFAFSLDTRNVDDMKCSISALQYMADNEFGVAKMRQLIKDAPLEDILTENAVHTLMTVLAPNE